MQWWHMARTGLEEVTGSKGSKGARPMVVPHFFLFSTIILFVIIKPLVNCFT